MGKKKLFTIHTDNHSKEDKMNIPKDISKEIPQKGKLWEGERTECAVCGAMPSIMEIQLGEHLHNWFILSYKMKFFWFGSFDERWHSGYGHLCKKCLTDMLHRAIKELDSPG